MEIKIERLRSPTLIFRKGGDFGTYGDFAEVQECDFDGHDYVVTARFMESDGVRSWAGETEVQFTVEPGSSVTYGGVGMPLLRTLCEIDDDEMRAKIEADNAATRSMISKANSMIADMRGEV